MLKIMLMLFLLFNFIDVSAASEDTSRDPAPVNSKPIDSKPIDENANDKDTCASKWDRYLKSQDCFAPYHNVDGSMKPGAHENCTDIKYPAECPRR